MKWAVRVAQVMGFIFTCAILGTGGSAAVNSGSVVHALFIYLATLVLTTITVAATIIVSNHFKH